MSGSDESPPDWKLRLRYGRLETPYSHFTLLGAGELRDAVEWSDCPPGPAILGMKIWASSHDEAFAVFREHDVAAVVADTAGRWPMAEQATSDLRYVRLHGDQELYTSGYGDAALDRWAEKCRAWSREQDVFVYFDNDAKGFAPHDALRLIARLQ